MSFGSRISALTPNFQLALITPAIDVAFGSIGAAYGTPSALVNPAVILILSNFTNAIVDYSLDGGATTQGHLLPQSYLVFEFKNNMVVLSATHSIAFKANSTLPTSGFCSITNISI